MARPNSPSDEFVSRDDYFECRVQPKHNDSCPPVVIIGCGSCQETIITDIPLCPEVRRPFDVNELRVRRIPIIKKENVIVCKNKVLARGIIKELITYKDFMGEKRTRLFCIPVECCIDVPQTKPRDTVAHVTLKLECKFMALHEDGSILHQVLCVKVEVAIESDHTKCRSTEVLSGIMPSDHESPSLDYDEDLD